MDSREFQGNDVITTLTDDIATIRAACERIRKLDAQATKTVWFYDTYNTVLAGTAAGGDLVEICNIPDIPETGECPVPDRSRWYPESESNALLIVASRNAIMTFVALAEALVEGIEIQKEVGGQDNIAQEMGIRECARQFRSQLSRIP